MNKSLGLVVSLIAACSPSQEETSGSTARVRVAHLSPGAPAVDFCLAAAGSGEDHRVNAGVVLDPVEDVHQAVNQRITQGVQLFGTIERQQRYCAVRLG